MKQSLLGFSVTVALAALVSCESFNQPVSGSFDPLDSPGSRSAADDSLNDIGPAYSAGQYVETSVPSAALYARMPRANEQPYRTLAVGTPLRIISTEGTYVKVELESGDIGYVPSIMVANKSAGSEVPIVPVRPGEIPLTGPGIDPYTGLAPEPEVAPLSVEEAQAPATINPGDIIE
jgi:hypothetical protein